MIPLHVDDFPAKLSQGSEVYGGLIVSRKFLEIQSPNYCLKPDVLF